MEPIGMVWSWVELLPPEWTTTVVGFMMEVAAVPEATPVQAVPPMEPPPTFQYTLGSSACVMACPLT